MNLLKLFGKRTEEPVKEEEPEEELDVYSGMRVEVTDADGRMLFVAKLLGLRGSQAELHQYSESDLPQEEEPLPVKIRGYSDRKRKAVYMEGAITPMPQHKWSVTELRVCKVTTGLFSALKPTWTRPLPCSAAWRWGKNRVSC